MEAAEARKGNGKNYPKNNGVIATGAFQSMSENVYANKITWVRLQDHLNSLNLKPKSLDQMTNLLAPQKMLLSPIGFAAKQLRLQIPDTTPTYYIPDFKSASNLLYNYTTIEKHQEPMKPYDHKKQPQKPVENLKNSVTKARRKRWDPQTRHVSSF